MRKISLFSLFSLFAAVCLPLGALAQVQDIPAMDAKALADVLKQLKDRHSASRNARLAQVLQEVSAAASSNSAAFAYYIEALRATTASGHTVAVVHDWKQRKEAKEKEEARFKAQEAQTAIRLHLQYLTLTLQYVMGATPESLLSPLVAYCNQVMSCKKEVLEQEILGQAVNNSLFIRRLGISKAFREVKGWEWTPRNIDGIWTQTILPQLRERKSMDILAYWDNRIQRETKAASETNLAFTIENFEQIVKPTLLKSRAQELVHLGLRNRAINELLNLIKTYPDHPDNSEWIQELVDFITPKPAEPETSGTTSTTGTAGTTGTAK